MKKVLLSAMVLASTATFAQTWTVQSTGFSEQSRGISKMDVVNPTTVWAIAYDGTDTSNDIQEFTRTTDGGNTWIPGTISEAEGMILTNVSAVDGNTAYVGMVSRTAGMGGLLKTTDGGMSWEPLNEENYINADSFFNVVHFFDANNGVTQGDPINGQYELYRTSDAGATWTAVTAPAPQGGEYGYNGGNPYAGTSFWYVTNKGNIYRTTDMGMTFQKFNAPVTDFSGTNAGGDLFFSDNNVGMLVRRLGSVASPNFTMFRTFDGGATWDAGAPSTAPLGAGSYAYIPGSQVIVKCSQDQANPGSAYSNDNGATWTVFGAAEQRGTVQFANGTTGWSAGFSTDENTGGIFKFNGSFTLGTNDVAAAKKFTASPNPTSGILTLSSDNATISEVYVIDMLGKQVLNASFDSVNTASVNMSSLNAGVYIVSAKDAAGKVEVMRVVKN